MATIDHPAADSETEIVIEDTDNPDAWIRSDTWVPRGAFQ